MLSLPSIQNCLRGVNIFYVDVDGERNFPGWNLNHRGPFQLLGKLTECFAPGNPYMTINLQPTVLEVADPPDIQ